MKDNLIQLLEASEHQCELQQKIIEHQKAQISNLEEINDILQRKVNDLSTALDKTEEICQQQQALLDAVFKNS